MMFYNNHLNLLINTLEILGIDTYIYIRVRFLNITTPQKEAKLFYFSLVDPDTH